jgi:peptidyl-prolyl cis-trans isomerase D
MLQNIRDKAQGWIAYGIVILISVPFALWGIQEYLGLGSEQVVAKVNGEEISLRTFESQYQRFRQQLREQLGKAYRPELFDDSRMREELLDRMVREQLIEQVSHDMGLRVSEAETQAAIRGIEAFQTAGRFDQDTFERAARYQGLTAAGLFERMRKALLIQQLGQAVSTSTFITEHEAAQAWRLMNQQREVSYFVVPAADYRVENPIGDEEIETYYSANQAEFAVPERVKLDFIHLDVTSAGDTLEVTPEDLRRYYDDHQEKFGLPEQRKASHILIQASANADEKTLAEAQGKIEALVQRLAQGEDFAELAKANSQDPGSAADGGDLGFFGRGLMDPAFEAAAFALTPGQISEPVRSSFGFHLIKLVDIKPARVKPFADAKREVEQTLRKDEGERRYFEMAEKLADLSYDASDSLEPAAEALDLSIRHSDWVTREKGSGVLASPKALSAAFNEDVLVQGHNSELIELDGESSLVLRVVEHEEATTLPLSEVRERIVETLRQQNAEAQAQAEADSRAQRIREGASLSQVAGNFAVTGPLKLGRADRSAPRELISAVFSSPKPTQGGVTVDSVRLSNGDVALFALHQVEEGGDAGQAEKDMLRQRLGRSLERSLYDALVTDLKTYADIEITLPKSSDE